MAKQTTELLSDLEARMASGPGAVDSAACLLAADAILGESDGRKMERSAQIGLRICQKLHSHARSLDALPIALATFQRTTDFEMSSLNYYASVACGLLSSDTADFAGAVEFYGRALSYAVEQTDHAAAGRLWSNIGSALLGVGRYELASAGFRQALAALDFTTGPQFGRYGALTNLAQCAMHSGELVVGLKWAQLALKELELGRSTFKVDPFNELLLRRNMIRLFVADGDMASADQQIQFAKSLGAQDKSVRSSIAVASAQAAIDIARGKFDIAATRLEASLEPARSSRPALQDMLACMVRADEASGNPARALVRLQELSDLMHEAGTNSAKAHLALAAWRQAIHAFADESSLQSTESRLSQSRGRASIPATWSTLTRLALGSALQIDPTAAHGTRVGALSRLLAHASGQGPVQALEIGLAAQIHDVGIAADQESLLGSLGNTAYGVAAEDDLSHCDAGWKILCDDDHPRILVAREIARYHHAWVNGKGHPGGLVGRAIPLHARICAVADAYDNIMSSDRQSGGDTIASGLVRLKSLSGSRLDPELVEIFVDVLQDETRNEGIEFDSGPGLASFHQLIGSLSRTQRYV